jgi:hypothetical protein
MYIGFIRHVPALSLSSLHLNTSTSMRASLHRQIQWPQSQLLSMTCAGSVRGAQSGQSTRPCQLQRGRETCQVRHQCGRRQWTSSCSFGRDSKDRVAEPSVGRMRRTRAARGTGRLGGHGECGQPLHEVVSHQSVPVSKTGTYWKEWCAFLRSGSWADGPAGASWLRSLCKTCESGVTGALRLQLGSHRRCFGAGWLNVVSIRG